MIGGYRIERVLGQGAMGTLYLAIEPGTGTPVALKTIALANQVDPHDLPAVQERFLREAQAASRLRHSNIVRTLGAGTDRGTAYIVMEALAGTDLSRYTRPARLLPETLVLEIAAGVADGLAYAHEAGVVHRDIKPANVVVDLPTRQVKIADFGIARLADSARTRTGLVVGTPAFMSPEQLAGAPADGRSDLYALGVLLFQLLTARLPYEGESMGELLRAIASQPPQRLRAIRPALPAALDELLARALQKAPHLRVPDGRQFAQSLREIAAQWPPSAHAEAAAIAAHPTQP